MRFREIIEHTVLWARFQLTIDEAQNNWLRSLGKNDFLHSKNVEMILDRLVPDHIKTDQNIFDHGEIFILLEAIYLHDIGRLQSNLHHEMESYEIIKNNYSKFHLQNLFEADAISQVCAAHADEAIWPIKKCEKNYGISNLTSSGRTFNLQKLGALLRIADELDNSFIRVNGLRGEEGSIRHIIRDVNPIPSKGIVEIQAHPITWEDWIILLKIKDYTQKRIREVQSYLEESKLEYYQVWLRPNNFQAPLNLPQPISNYHDLIESVANLIAPRFTSVEMLENINNCEISILCKDIKFGITTITAILVTPNLDKSTAYEFRGALTYLRDQHKIHTGMVVVEQQAQEDVKHII
uniref:HD domain-containing protein n=1 Tax=Desulfobulbus sp. TaxID=895 RepID=UPI0027BAFEED